MSSASVNLPPMLPAQRTRRWAIAGLAVALVALAYVYCVDPSAAGSITPGCVLHDLTGLYCPGCGGTRAMHALMHGHVRQAVAFNPMIFVAVPLGAATLLRAAWIPDRSPKNVLSPAWIWLIFAALVAFWIARNIPVYPFTLLAPG